jgi:hypothetical protein
LGQGYGGYSSSKTCELIVHERKEVEARSQNYTFVRVYGDYIPVFLTQASHVLEMVRHWYRGSLCDKGVCRGIDAVFIWPDGISNVSPSCRSL